MDEECLAKEVKKGLKTFGHVKKAYVELGVKLLDGFPSEKHDVKVTSAVRYEELEGAD